MRSFPMISSDYSNFSEISVRSCRNLPTQSVPHVAKLLSLLKEGARSRDNVSGWIGFRTCSYSTST